MGSRSESPQWTPSDGVSLHQRTPDLMQVVGRQSISEGMPGGTMASKQSSNKRPFPPEENNYWSRRTAGCCMMEGTEGVQVWSRVACAERRVFRTSCSLVKM